MAEPSDPIRSVGVAAVIIFLTMARSAVTVKVLPSAFNFASHTPKTTSEPLEVTLTAPLSL